VLVKLSQRLLTTYPLPTPDLLFQVVRAKWSWTGLWFSKQCSAVFRWCLGWERLIDVCSELLELLSQWMDSDSACKLCWFRLFHWSSESFKHTGESSAWKWEMSVSTSGPSLRLCKDVESCFCYEPIQLKATKAVWPSAQEIIEPTRDYDACCPQLVSFCELPCWVESPCNSSHLSAIL